MRYLLAHDIGTSGDKATLFTEEGTAVASCLETYPLYQEGPLFAEQDGNDWWKAFCRSTATLISGSGIDPREIEAVSFSGQMMGCLPVDDNGVPLRRSIIWADQRSGEEVELIRKKIDDDAFYSLTGHRNTPSYSIQKAMWVKRHQPEIYERTRAFLNAKDFIVMKLTGRFVTDPSDANGVCAFDLRGLRWSQEVLDAAGIEISKLPVIVPSDSVVGTVRSAAAVECSLSEITKVIMGAGDGVAANVGAGSVSPGSAYLCMGTSAWVASTEEEPIFDELKRSVTWAHAVRGLYSPNATMQYCCGTYDWFRKTLLTGEKMLADNKGEDVHSLIQELAEKAEPGSGGVIFLPHLLGERAPRWNPDVSGGYIGLSGMTSKEDIVRSTFEGISYNLALDLDAVNQKGNIHEITLIGGGAKNDFWAQLLADMFGMPTLIQNMTGDANSMGAAVIAGVGSGIFSDFSEVRRFISIKKKFLPRPELTAFYSRGKERFDACYKAMEVLY
ncbi:MAG: FGGY-family carbohydrate kinase [Clostridia bacterium]|nr:FGGY-family carbohydrate kinase [Clostridia bacterium]